MSSGVLQLKFNFIKWNVLKFKIVSWNTCEMFRNSSRSQCFMEHL